MLLTLDTDNAIYNNNLAMTYADANENLGRAHSLALKANRLDPDNPGHIDTLGWVLVRMEQFDEAEQVILRAIRLAGEDGRNDLSEVYYHLGFLYRQMERHQEADDVLAKALQNPPTPFLRAEIERLLMSGPEEKTGPR
jgi:tetratricopeptide (TPR) repeat protein